VTDEVPATEHLAAGTGTHESAQVVLRNEDGDHFTGAQRVFVDEGHYLPVKRLRAKALRH
jgi:hypothetical protein